jgi:hypothetical protein
MNRASETARGLLFGAFDAARPERRFFVGWATGRVAGGPAFSFLKRQRS